MYLVQMTLNYNKLDKIENEKSYTSKVHTIGVFNDIDEAYSEGNKVCEELEKRWELNKAYNVKRRLKDGWLNNSIGNLAYIKTPFHFNLQVIPLHMGDIAEMLDKVQGEIEELMTWEAMENA